MDVYFQLTITYLFQGVTLFLPEWTTQPWSKRELERRGKNRPTDLIVTDLIVTGLTN